MVKIKGDFHRVLILYHMKEHDNKKSLVPLREYKIIELLDQINESLHSGSTIRMMASAHSLSIEEILKYIKPHKFKLIGENLYTFKVGGVELAYGQVGVIAIDNILLKYYRPRSERRRDRKEERLLDDIAIEAIRRKFFHGILLCKGINKCGFECMSRMKCIAEEVKMNSKILKDLFIHKLNYMENIQSITDYFHYLSIYYAVIFSKDEAFDTSNIA